MPAWRFLIRKLIKKGTVDHGCTVLWRPSSCLLSGSRKVLLITSCREGGDDHRPEGGEDEIVLMYVRMAVGCRFPQTRLLCRQTCWLPSGNSDRLGRAHTQQLEGYTEGLRGSDGVTGHNYVRFLNSHLC